MVKRKIWVTFKRKGLHCYPDAGKDSSLRDVNYLGNVHRHLFYFRVGIEVGSENREIEFHQFLNWLESLYDSGILELGSKSCEMICMDLIDKVKVKYGGREIVVDVSEDGECGSTVEYLPGRLT